MFPEKNSLGHIMGYTIPVLHRGKTWYVDFYAFDPASGEMRRKKYHIDSIKGIKAKKQRAAEICAALTQKLRGGWNPWAQEGSNRAYALFTDVIDRYLQSIEKTSRRKTFLSYSSRANILKQYIETMAVPVMYAYQYDSALIVDFLDWLYLDREVTARTRNNYRGWCFSFGAWMAQRKYIQSNPAEGITNISETAKIRTDLTQEQLRLMKSHLEQSEPHYLLACLMEYYTFIRPTELSHLKIKDIDVKWMRIFIPAAVSKNKRDGYVALNRMLLRMMIQLGTFQYPGEYYLFSNGFKPGNTRRGPDVFNKRWKVMRKALRWPETLQFYSLKDSGIRDLANAEGIVTARDQARHSDVATTNKYLTHSGIPVHPEVKSFEGAFSEINKAVEINL